MLKKLKEKIYGFRAFQFRISDFGFRIESPKNLDIRGMKIQEFKIDNILSVNS